MTIPTEPIGSIPRPLALIEATQALKVGEISQCAVDAMYREAVRETIRCFEATGSIGRYLKPDQRAFVGVIDVVSARVETPEEVRNLVLQAAEHIPLSQLGTTDDCGFSPFSDDTSTSRDMAFAKIRARVQGTALACDELERRGNHA